MEEHPIEKRDTRAEAIGAVVRFAFTFSIVIGIWGLALNKDFVLFGIIGAILGSILSLILVVPVILNQRTEESLDNIVSAANTLWGGVAVYAIIFGVIAWIIRIIFF